MKTLQLSIILVSAIGLTACDDGQAPSDVAADLAPMAANHTATPTPHPSPNPSPSSSPSASPSSSPTPAPAACTFGGHSVASGSHVTAYQNLTVPAGQSCTSQQRTCTNGTLSGTFVNATCTVQAVAAAPCNFNGQSIADGGQVSAYLTATVPFGQTCASQTRTCSNGTLSGSYGYSACTVQSGAVAPTNTGSFVVGGVTYTFSSLPVAGSSTNFGSLCHAYTVPASGGFAAMTVLNVYMGSVVDPSGNYQGMNFWIYNYAASTTQYTMNDSLNFPGIGGDISINTTATDAYVTNSAFDKIGPKSTCSFNVATAGGRVSGGFACSNLYTFPQLVANTATSGYTAAGNFNCALQ